MIGALCVCLRAMQSIILYANETYDRGWLRLASPHLLPSFEPGRRNGTESGEVCWRIETGIAPAYSELARNTFPPELNPGPTPFPSNRFSCVDCRNFHVFFRGLR